MQKKVFLVFQGLSATTTRFPWDRITFGIGDGWTGLDGTGGMERVDMDTDTEVMGRRGHIHTAGNNPLNRGGTRHVSSCCQPLWMLRFLADSSQSPSPDCWR